MTERQLGEISPDQGFGLLGGGLLAKNCDVMGIARPVHLDDMTDDF